MNLRPRWCWALVDASGTAVDRPASPVFLARFEAEQWLGEHWRGLAAQGVRTASLEHDGMPQGAPVELPAP
ncbi:hypothetical protein [Cellulomonas shaoxiangyii]|uniref:Uncharacterized protein n=1 Tax=Cellulomonas shaoxiangyii TaxID=2566013 RepID=A0A4P7SIM1_9CELL|nr:hypothetical protein [Cellulomonas shaoxiangyii]QCB93387.1 hypothetical protein E5225_07280 [Cellulomonas shaoxiangyii]TGY85349.1 hypothetical protein E5226_07205 [Cellulomonas shaoxiangyii]